MNRDRARDILSHPLVYPYLRNDTWPEDPADLDFDKTFGDSVLFTPDENTLFIYTPFMTSVMQMHVAIKPEGRGIRSKINGRLALEYAFTMLKVFKLVGFIPEWNKRSIRYALSHGFKIEGCMTKSTVRNAALYGIIMVGLDLETWHETRISEVLRKWEQQ